MRRLPIGALALLATLLAWPTGPADASEPEPSWRLEQPTPPPPAPGVPPAASPVGLGRVGDVEFWAPNRGVLITAGNGSTIPTGLWAYDGTGWHELATVCGASDGRVAWAGPHDFWTVSDGRPGQAANPANGEPAPLADRTLCHFSGSPVQVVGSYASPAFEADSYQQMQAAACLGESDCWFAGDPLPEPQVGSFHLHWDGHTLSEQPNPQGHAVQDMTAFGRYLYESVRLGADDLLSEPEPSPPWLLHRIAPAGYQPTFLGLSTRLPRYSPGELPPALDYLRLSADAERLWAAAGPSLETPEGSTPAEVTLLRYERGVWTQLLGPSTDPETGNPLAGWVIDSVAAEPGGGAWLSLDTPADARSPGPLASAWVARVAPDGTVSAPQQLPAPGAGWGPKGAAGKIVCPAHADCWMTTTQGWLFHFSDGAPVQADADTPFTGLVGFRPIDEGLPPVEPDAPPADDSGVIESFQPPFVPVVEKTETSTLPRVRVPLLSHVSSRLVHRYTLELRFHLAVRARVRLLARRHRAIVARTRVNTLAAGTRRLRLRLDPRRWPTRLALQTHALAPLPTVAADEAPGETGSGGGGVVVSAWRTPALSQEGGLRWR